MVYTRYRLIKLGGRVVFNCYSDNNSIQIRINTTFHKSNNF